MLVAVVCDKSTDELDKCDVVGWIMEIGAAGALMRVRRVFRMMAVDGGNGGSSSRLSGWS